MARWLKPVHDLARAHAGELDALLEDARADRLAESNVVAQIESIARTDVVRDAWRKGQPLARHGLIFCVRHRLLRDLHVGRGAPGAGAAPQPANADPEARPGPAAV